jgi:1-pyrroline-5-carboxylate dehydrogenase
MLKLPKNLIPKFKPGSKITPAIMGIISDLLEDPVTIPNIYPSTTVKKQTSAFNNKKHIANYTYRSPEYFTDYFKNYNEIKEHWNMVSTKDKTDIFLGAANLLETKYYDKMLAYTIAGQNKNIYEAEIDAICELSDFLRFNVRYFDLIQQKQPLSAPFVHNYSEYNPLNGFVASITPFNFTAIGGNLASAPLLFGNTVLWKPSDNAVLSNYLFYQIMLEAGLPKGVLNFCPNDPQTFFDTVNERNDLGAICFTGSSEVFDNIYKEVGKGISNRNNYTRLIGETGGKNFHFVDDSFNSNLEFLADETVQSAFGYSGQKCSACSILYLPENLLDIFIPILKRRINSFMEYNGNYGLINSNSFKKTLTNINNLKRDTKNIDVLIDTAVEKTKTYHVSPFVVKCSDHNHSVFKQEYFAPILAIYPYPTSKTKETLNLCSTANNYALTGSIFSTRENFIDHADKVLKSKTGNFYINCRSTGSIVGNQPFGGSGKSGTNDKAGDMNILYRLFNQRNVKINQTL